MFAPTPMGSSTVVSLPQMVSAPLATSVEDALTVTATANDPVW
jgi:hypothetical protein